MYVSVCLFDFFFSEMLDFVVHFLLMFLFSLSFYVFKKCVCLLSKVNGFVLSYSAFQSLMF